MKELIEKLKALSKYMYKLDKQGFGIIKELPESYILTISHGYIPHGHHSESWWYRIDVNRTYILKREDQEYALIEGFYETSDSSRPLEEEEKFPCIALIKLPKGKLPINMNQWEVKENIVEFYEIAGNKLKKRAPTGF